MFRNKCKKLQADFRDISENFGEIKDDFCRNMQKI